MFTELPRGWLPRALAGSRIARALGRSAARRVVGADPDGERLGEALVAELDGMKGLAMKVGQILSTVDAGLPEATRARLAALQRGAEPMAPDQVEVVIAQALGRPAAELFDGLDPVPIAAASVGQVHRATVGGRPVAVKVRYPGVEESITGDLASLGVIASLASAATAVDGPALVHELRTRMLEECDYTREAAWLGAAGPCLRSVGVVVPEVLPDRSARTVLTTGWEDGRPLEAGPLSPAVAERLLATGWDTLFAHGFLHADPHPGNYLVRGDTLVVLDWGCVRRAGPEEVEPVRLLLRAVLAGDRARYPTLAADAGLVGAADRFDDDEGWAQLRWLCAPYLGGPYTFDPAWAIEGRRFNRPGASNQRSQALPPLWIWLLRTLVAHHGVLARQRLTVAARPLLEAALARPLVPLPDPTTRPDGPAVPRRG